MNPSIDTTWHLTKTEEEAKLTELELHLGKMFHVFSRWQEDCEKVANQTNLTSSELSVLHVIRMKDRPKTHDELMRLLNRDDSFNITYSLKKLIKNGLIRKVVSDKHNKKTLSYEVTKEGIENTDAYKALRKKVLIELVSKNPELNLDGVSDALSGFSAMYREAYNKVLS